MRNIYFSSFLFLLFFLFSFSVNEKPKYSVYIFLHDACLISQYYTLTLDSLHNEFASDEIKFIGVFPNESSEKSDIDMFKYKYELDFDMIQDEGQIITKRFGAKVTPEVFVYDELKEEVVYKGRIDNAYFRVGKRRTVRTTSELKDVMIALKTGNKVLTKNQIAIGCFIQEK